MHAVVNTRQVKDTKVIQPIVKQARFVFPPLLAKLVDAIGALGRFSDTPAVYNIDNWARVDNAHRL